MSADQSRHEIRTIEDRFDRLLLGARITRGSTTSRSDVKRAFDAARPDCVLHLAAPPLVASARRDPGSARDAIVGGTSNLLLWMPLGLQGISDRLNM